MPRHVLAQRADGAVEPWRDDRRYRGESAGRDYVDDKDLDDEPGADWSAQLAALRRHKVTLACAALILASLVWKAAFLSHYYYRQDDFDVFDIGLKSSLSWSYLSHLDAGHFFPGVYVIAWVLAHVALYNWLAGSAVVLVMIAAASLAAWRVLVTLLGNRPAILIPLALYLLSPLAFPTYSWWITAVEAIPLQIALFMALNSHVHYVWTGNFRYAVASAAWQFFGLFFFEKSAVIPLLLFAITVGFLTGRRLLPGLRATITQLWKGWLLYLGLLVAYSVVFLLAASSSGPTGAPAHSLQPVYAFSSKLVLNDLLPGLLGGPWRWLHTQNSLTAYAWPSHAMVWVSLVVVLATVAASILVRRRAWRAWAILAGWVVLADIVPIVVGRLGYPPAYAGIFGLTTRYVDDAPAVLAIVIALAFWPVAGPERAGDASVSRRREFLTGRRKAIAIAMVGLIVAGSVWSVQRFQTLTTTGMTVVSNRAYIANARAALAETPAGTVIVSQHVPSTMMLGIFGRAADTSVVLGPLSDRGSQVHWTSQPSGTIGQLKVFGSDGRLWPAAVAGSTTVKLPFARSCLTAKKPRLVLPFQPVSVSFAEILRLGYAGNLGAAGQIVTVTYGSFVGRFTAMSGLHKVYFPVHGSAASVVVQAAAGGLCFAPAVAGYVIPFPGGPIPSTGG